MCVIARPFLDVFDLEVCVCLSVCVFDFFFVDTAENGPSSLLRYKHTVS